MEGIVTQIRVAAEVNDEVTPLIDERMLGIANEVTGRPGAFFQSLGETALLAENRPDSIKHNKTLLTPNAYNTAETNERLSYLDFLFDGEVESITDKFTNFTDEHKVFERIVPAKERAGEKFLFVFDHSEMANLGYAAGFMHLAAREQGVDRLEDHLGIVVGRPVGYFTFNDENVIDGILRKVGSVIKTFPKTGGEAMSEDLEELRLFRAYCNRKTKQTFTEFLDTHDGKIMIMAPSGAEDVYDKTLKRSVMETFGKGSSEMMIEASQTGATVVPVSFARHAGGSIVEFCQPVEPGKLTTIADCHEVGRTIASVATLARGKASARHPDDNWYKTPVVYKSAS